MFGRGYRMPMAKVDCSGFIPSTQSRIDPASQKANYRDKIAPSSWIIDLSHFGGRRDVSVSDSQWEFGHSGAMRRPGPYSLQFPVRRI
jgi:hypothetical protein